RSELAGPARLERTATSADTRNPLQQAAVLVLPGERVLYYQRVHHIAADGYAVALITARVAALYSALVAGQSYRPAPPGGLADLVAAEQCYQAGTQREDDRRFWHDLLAAAPPAASLSPRTAAATTPVLAAAGTLDGDAF